MNTVRLKILATLCLIILMGVLTYGEIRTYFFTDVDTFSLINSGRFEGWQGALNHFQSELMAGRMINAIYYRPLTSLVFGSAFHLFKLEPKGYHTINLTLFLLTAFWVFLLGYAIWGKTKGFVIGLLACLFFLLHPLQVDNVPAIARLGDLLGVFWATLSILTFWLFFQKRFLQSNKKPGLFLLYGLSMVALFLAACSKEPMIVTPGIMTLIILFFDPNKQIGRRIKRGVLLLTPFALTIMTFLFLRWQVLGGLGGYVSKLGAFDEKLISSYKTKATFLGHFYGLLGPGFSDSFNRLATPLFETNAVFYPLLVTFFVLLTVFTGKGLIRLIQKREQPHQSTALYDRCWRYIFILTIMIHGALLWVTLFSPRYLYYATISFCLLLGLMTYNSLINISAGLKPKLGALIMGLLLVFIYWHCPLWKKDHLRRWKIGGEVVKKYLNNLTPVVHQHPKEKVFLLNTPYLINFGSISPIFWEIPFNQLLLEHALIDYLDIIKTFDQRPQSEILILNYLFIKGPPEILKISSTFHDSQTLTINVSSGGTPSPFPWTEIPGRNERTHLFTTTGGRTRFEDEPPGGWSNEMTIHLEKAFFQQKPYRFYAFNGENLQEIKSPSPHF